MNKWKYVHRGKINNWHEGLMLGNGHIGALIYGGDNLTLSLDRIDLWDNRYPPELKEKGFNYQNMIKTMKEDWDEYLRLFDNCYNHPYPTKLNAGSIIFEQEINKTTSWELNIKNAFFNVKANENSYSGYLDANKDVLVLFVPNNAHVSFKMPEYLSDEDEKTGLGYPDATEENDGSFKYIIQQTKCGFNYGVLIYETSLNNQKVMLISVFKGDLKEKKELLTNYLNNYEENKKQHEKYWKKYYFTSTITTKNNKVDRLHNFGRYFLACNSRKDYPMSLEGVWTRNDGRLPPWKGDYHMDINLQMSYESYMKTGNFQEGKVLVDYLWNNRNTFKHLAKTFCQSEGYFIPGVMSQNCTPLGGWPMYALNPCDGIWIATAFDNYYRYTNKETFLKNRAFPFFSNIEKCISSLLVKNKEGHLQLEFSASPEINDCERTAILSHQSNFELGMLHYLYRTLINYSEKLGLDSSYYKKQQSLLSDYYRNENGEMTISKDLDYSVSHRHFSHILCHKNLENFNPYQNYNQIKKDFDRLERYGHDEWVGFSFTEASSLASYIGLGEEAYKFIKVFEDGFVNNNGFHMNMDFKHKGYSKIHSYAFTLEANIGFVRAVSDMMLRTTDGVITVFPAISEELKQKGVSFKKLRSHSNHKIDGSYHNGKESFLIRLSKAGSIKLFNNINNSFVLEIDGVKQIVKAEMDSIIELSANKTIKYVEE